VHFWEQHLKSFLSQYTKDFYWRASNFLSAQEVEVLLSAAKSAEKKALLRPAAIGKGERKKKIKEIRSDKIYWVDDFTTDSGKIMQAVFLGLLEIVRKELYMPAKRFECHLTKYEVGDRYLLHRDRHSVKPGRLLTCVIYLSDCARGSGSLVLYDQDLKPVVIQPKAGSIVVFDSSLEHEVKEVKADRYSLTGWIRDDLHTGIRL